MRRASHFTIAIAMSICGSLLLQSYILSNTASLNEFNEDRTFYGIKVAKADGAAAAAADSVIQAKIESLEKFNVSFYIYDDPNITLPENVHGNLARGPAKWGRYGNEVEVDEQILAALEKSALRTHDHTKATLFIPPVPFGKIITSKRPHNYIHGAMNSLLAHDIFKRHQGHNHLIISISYTFFRGAKLGDFNPLRLIV